MVKLAQSCTRDIGSRWALNSPCLVQDVGGVALSNGRTRGGGGERRLADACSCTKPDRKLQCYAVRKEPAGNWIGRALKVRVRLCCS